MHTGILKLVYINSELVHVSANHLAIFRDAKCKGYHILFNQTAALVLYNFSFVFLYESVFFACWAFINFM
jgi:hypothetical protein